MQFEVLREELFEGREEAPGITIDGPTSMDLDDAIWLENKNENFVLHVSIADVGAIVKINSYLDKKAVGQGFTHYYKHGNKPMLNRHLSDDALSLHENMKRPTITITIPIDKNLNVGEVTLSRTYVVNAKKLSYEKAQKAMESGEFAFLSDAYELSNRLFEQRKINGALVFNDNRKGIATNEEGQIIVLDKSQRFNSRLIIQEFMILTNQAVAEYFAKNNIPALYRNHKARASAPDRIEIQNDLETTILDGNPDRITTLSNRMNLILEKAVYAPTLSGHYALNLPAYMHFTSPIRRYADLINHRQIAAILTDQELPYDFDMLTTIADQINSLEKEIKDKKAEHFKEKANAETLKALETNIINDLEPKEFHKVLKLAANKGHYNDELKEQISKRLESDQLKAREIFTILLESKKDDENWNNLRNEAIEWLHKNPFHSYSIIAIASQTLEWSLPVYETKSLDQHPKIYKTTCSVSIDTKIYTSELRTAYSKKKSEQYSTLNILEKVLDIESKYQEPIQEQNNDFEKPEENYKGLLQNKCQKNKWQLPTYKSSESGSSHSPVFTVVAEINFGDKTIASEPAVGPNIKTAEQLAAESLMNKIIEIQKAEKEESPIKPLQTEVAKPHFITLLQDFYQGTEKPLPRYDFEEISLGFKCRCTAVAPDGTQKQYEADGTTKKYAKRNVAKIAYDELSGMFGGD